MTDPVASLFDSITGGPSAQSTIANLQQENAELRAQLSAAQLSKAARQQLDKCCSSTRAATGSWPRT